MPGSAARGLAFAPAVSRPYCRGMPRASAPRAAPAIAAILAAGMLSACAAGGNSLPDSLRASAAPAAAASGAGPEAAEGQAPEAAPTPAAAGLPPAPGRRPADLDTTTAEERAAALSAPAAPAGRELGRVRVSLGNPNEPGIWIETPLVSAPVQGRAVWPATGAGIAVELRPATDASGTSRISLPALRLIGAPLTALPELVLFAS